MARKRRTEIIAEPARPPGLSGAARRLLSILVLAGGIGTGIAAAVLLFGRPESAEPPPAAVTAVAAQESGARPRFDAARSFEALEKQVRMGPRVSGMPGHAACRDYFLETLRPLADSVERQDFTARVRGRNLGMSNVVARWKGKTSGNGVILCAHWDTRPTADYEFSAAGRRMPIPGANDGASGVAVLLEVAQAFKKAPPPVPVMMVFFDGEDYGPGLDHMFLGSRYFADHLPADVPKRGILLDMVGDRDLVIPREAYSVQMAPEVVEGVYGAARKLGLERHFPSIIGTPIEDDHVQLHRKGLKVIDLIDFSYGPNHSWWHTLQDTPDKCSPASLKAVGEVVLEWTYEQR